MSLNLTRIVAEPVKVLPFEVREAEVAARVRTELKAKGTPMGPMDVLIAGTALANGATLITRNVREFERVEGLMVENWYDWTTWLSAPDAFSLLE